MNNSRKLTFEAKADLANRILEYLNWYPLGIGGEGEAGDPHVFLREAADALAQQEPPCNNPLRSEITCADLVRDNDNLREALAQAKALYLEELHTRALAQQAQPEH